MDDDLLLEVVLDLPVLLGVERVLLEEPVQVCQLRVEHLVAKGTEVCQLS